MKLESKGFRYKVKVIVDNKKGKIYSSAVKEVFWKIEFNIDSYEVDLKRIHKTNLIQTLTLESIRNLDYENLFTYWAWSQ